jgi:hypothetical protein
MRIMRELEYTSTPGGPPNSGKLHGSSHLPEKAPAIADRDKAIAFFPEGKNRK